MRACLLLLVLCFSTSYGQNQYCNIDLQHTLCQFQNVSPTCGTTMARGFNSSEKSTIVDMHNRLRSTVAAGGETRGRFSNGQPMAANMMSIKWDEELAMTAQRWADQCNFGHDVSRDVERFAVGQNIFEAGLFGGDVDLGDTVREGIIGVNGWYSEVAQFDGSGVDNYTFEPSTGHYSQLVWAETEYVGCGHITYANSNSGGYKRLLVCNYGPAGNFIGQPVYIRATPCSMCPFRSNCLEDQQLCHKESNNNNNNVGIVSSPAVNVQPSQPVSFAAPPTTTRRTTTTTTTTTTSPRVVFMPPRPTMTATTTTTTTPRPSLDSQSLAEVLRNLLQQGSSEENEEDFYYDDDEYEDEYEVDLEAESLRNKHTSQIPSHPEPYYYGDTPFYLGHGSYPRLLRPWRLNYLPTKHEYRHNSHYLPRRKHKRKKIKKRKMKKPRRLGIQNFNSDEEEKEERRPNFVVSNNVTSTKETESDFRVIATTQAAFTRPQQPTILIINPENQNQFQELSNSNNNHSVIVINSSSNNNDIGENMMEEEEGPTMVPMRQPPRNRPRRPDLLGGIKNFFGKVGKNIFGKR